MMGAVGTHMVLLKDINLKRQLFYLFLVARLPLTLWW